MACHLDSKIVFSKTKRNHKRVIIMILSDLTTIQLLFSVTIIYVFGGSAASRLESVSVCFHFFARDSLLKEFGTTNIMLKV